MKNRRNYYRILHVQPDAPVEVVKASFRTLMQRLGAHPDLGGEHWNAALLNEAYAVVSNPVRRQAYDRQLDWNRSAYRVEETLDPMPMQPACLFCRAAHQLREISDPHMLCHNCASPLCPAARPRLETDQRAVARMPRQQEFQYFTHWPQRNPYRGWTLDVSISGMKFVAQRPLTLDSLVKIDSQLCHAIARVANCAMDRRVLGVTWQVGVEFVTLCFERVNGSFVSAQA